MQQCRRRSMNRRWYNLPYTHWAHRSNTSPRAATLHGDVFYASTHTSLLPRGTGDGFWNMLLLSTLSNGTHELYKVKAWMDTCVRTDYIQFYPVYFPLNSPTTAVEPSSKQRTEAAVNITFPYDIPPSDRPHQNNHKERVPSMLPTPLPCATNASPPERAQLLALFYLSFTSNSRTIPAALLCTSRSRWQLWFTTFYALPRCYTGT